MSTAAIADPTMSKAIRAKRSVIEQASEVAESYGLSLASATRALWTQMARNRTIPLDFSVEQPNDESLEAIRETEEIIRNGRPHQFKDSSQMFATLELEA